MLGLRAQVARLVVVGERIEMVSEPPSEAAAQIIAQRELARRRASRRAYRSAPFAREVDGVDEGDLGVLVERTCTSTSFRARRACR